MQLEGDARVTDGTQESADLRVPDGAVLVHIGPHKTGTTSLQAALFVARDAMAAQGVHLAGGSRHPARATQAVTGRASPFGTEAPAMRHWHGLAGDVRRARGRRVVLSSEFLAYAGPDDVRRIVDDLGRDRVHVVTTLRPLARIIPSMWQQNVQAGRTIALADWIRRLFPDVGESPARGFWTLHRHDELIARWAEVVGPDRVTAVVADDADRHMVRRIFERLLGLDAGTLPEVESLSNRSLTAEEAEVLRAFNVAFRRGHDDKALYATIVRFGAAQYMSRLQPPAGCTRIELPDWSLDPIGRVGREIIAAVRGSGVHVIGDLASLAWLPAPGGPGGGRLPERVPPDAAARLAMGIVVASGNARAGHEPDADTVAQAIQIVASRGLVAALAARATASIARRPKRYWRVARSARARVADRLPRVLAPRRRAVFPHGSGILPPGSIVVHIGPPKTGTTAIQGAFHACRDDAERQGVHYAGRRRHSIAAIQAALGRPGFHTEGAPNLRYWHQLRNEIRASRAAYVLLSSEFLADATPDRIRWVVEELGSERVQVVVTLRPLAKILPSQWQQYVQSGARMGYGPWLDAMLNQPPGAVSPTFWHRHRDDQLIARWAAAVGADRLTAIVVDETDREAVLRTFEALVGLRAGTLHLQEELSNRSLSMEEAEAVRALNHAFAEAGLKRPLHSALINFGATEYLKTLPAQPGTSRIELPGWAGQRTAEIAGEIAAGIRTSGARIIGDVDRLTTVTTGAGPGPEGAEVGVPVAVAAHLGLGVLYATGRIDPPSAGRSASKARPGYLPWVPEPIEIARVPSGRLMREVAARAMRR